MSGYLTPLAYTVGLWWLSTGLILALIGAGKAPHRSGMIGASVVLVVATLGLVWARDDTSLAGAYLSFTCGVLIWGWHEVAFLSGTLTGPRKASAATAHGTWRHFAHATQTLIYHELAIALNGVVLLAICWQAANPLGGYAFMVLWLMRLSAKFNIFLGVPNLSVEMLPAHLGVLHHYLRRKTINPLFPLSITAATLGCAWLSHLALSGEPFAQTGYTLLAGLTLLGLIEHWFLVLPIKDATLWRWFVRDSAPDSANARGKPSPVSCP